MKIKVKLFEGGKLPIVTEKGDWFDIAMPSDGSVKGPHATILTQKRTRRTVEWDDVEIVNLGFAMALPKGYEALVLPRSSTYRKFNLGNTNFCGVIDNSYSGDNDQWMAQIKADKDTSWKAGDRLFQFRIQLSQKANFWQKLKWLFWNGKIEFVEVQSLSSKTRGTSMNGTTTNI